MLIHDHIEGATNLGEIRNFRQWNVAAFDTGITSSAIGILQFRTGSLDLGVHVGAGSWRRFMMAGDSMATAGMALTQNKLWVGDGSNVPQEVLKSAIPLSDWGTATNVINMGGYRVTNISSSSASSDAASVGYVDQRVQGLKGKNSCLLASNQALPSCTYVGGSTLTLTATANAALTNVMVDSGASGVTIAAGAEGAGSEFLIKNQAVSEQNGRYYLSQAGSAGTPWIMTRCSDANTNLKLKAAYTVVEQGTYADQGWCQTSDDFDITSVSSKFITWVLFNVAGSYSSGKGMITSGGNVFNFAKTTAYAAGDIFYGITGGSGDAATSKIDILAIGGAGRFMQVNTGATAPQWSSYSLPNTIAANSMLLASSASVVAELATVNSRVLVTSAGGAVSWGSDLPTATTIGSAYIYRASGTDVALIDGGTGSSLTAVNGGIVWSNASGLAITAAGNSGYFVRTAGAASPTFFDLFGSANTWTAANTYDAVTGTTLIALHTTGASNNALEITTRGKILFGTGTATPTIELYCSAAGTLLLGTTLFRMFPVGGILPTFQLSNAAGTGSVTLNANTAASDSTWTLPSTGTAGVWQATAGGVITCAALSGSSITGAALTKTDDTNVTMTLGGSPTTALLNASSITLGWTGTLGVARGGIGVGTLATNGVLYGNGTGAILALAQAATGTVLTGTGAAPAFSTTPSVTSITTTGQAGYTLNPFGVAAGNTGELRFLELVAGGTAYVGFKAPDGITANVIWTLPAADAAGFLKSTGAGVLSFAALAGSDITGAAVTEVDDTNVTLTLGGTPATAALRAFSITAGWTGTLATGRGGLGQATTVVQGGLLYAASGTTYQCSTAGTAGNIARSGGTGAVTWTGYTMPATLTGANSMFLSSAAGVVAELTPTANRILTTNGSSVVSWGGLLNVARNTAGGIARKFSNLVPGDGVNAYIVVTHNLGTRDVTIGCRESNSGDTGSQEQSFSKMTVEDTNTVRVYFNAIQTASDYHVVTVIG